MPKCFFLSLGFGKVATNIQMKKKITVFGEIFLNNTRPFKLNISDSTSAQNPGWLLYIED